LPNTSPSPAAPVPSRFPSLPYPRGTAACFLGGLCITGLAKTEDLSCWPRDVYQINPCLSSTGLTLHASSVAQVLPLLPRRQHLGPPTSLRAGICNVNGQADLREVLRSDARPGLGLFKPFSSPCRANEPCTSIMAPNLLLGIPVINICSNFD